MALAQSAELREVLLRFYEALERGDAAAVLDLISREDGVLSIGTDTTEWWSDYATLERVYPAQLREMPATGVRFQPGDVRCYQEGAVGWCADQPNLVMPDGTAVPLRLTAVLHHEASAWKIVQSHLSLGVANADVLGRDVTT